MKSNGIFSSLVLTIFFFKAGVTLTCAVLVGLLLRDSPLEAGFNCEFTPKIAKKKDDDNNGNSSTTEMTWKDLIRSPFLWLVGVAFLVVFAAKTSVTEWGQMFIIEELGHSPFVGIYSLKRVKLTND